MNDKFKPTDEARHHFVRAAQLADDAAIFDGSQSHASARWCREKAKRHLAKARELQAGEYDAFLAGKYEIPA